MFIWILCKLGMQSFWIIIGIIWVFIAGAPLAPCLPKDTQILNHCIASASDLYWPYDRLWYLIQLTRTTLITTFHNKMALNNLHELVFHSLPFPAFFQSSIFVQAVTDDWISYHHWKNIFECKQYTALENYIMHWFGEQLADQFCHGMI